MAWATSSSGSGWSCRRPGRYGRRLGGRRARRGGLRGRRPGNDRHSRSRRPAREIAAARRLTDRPIAVNLLLPFARRGHFEAASEADVVVTFWGSPKRRTAKTWIHQCGSVEEALAAREAGADAVIAQGVEAGGHVRGTTAGDGAACSSPRGAARRLPGALGRRHCRRRRRQGPPRRRRGGGGLRHPLPDDRGERRPSRLQGAIDRGARDDPHRALRRRLAGAAPRRCRTQATARWLRRDPRGPAWLRAFHKATAPVVLAGAGADAVPPGGDAEAEPADLRSCRGDRRRTLEPDRRGAALRRASASTASATSGRRASSSASSPAD